MPYPTASAASGIWNLNQIANAVKGGDWPVSGLAIEYLVIAGGGGNQSGQGAQRESGSGAGGYRSSVSGEDSGGGASAEPIFVGLPGDTYTVTVGAGGSGRANGSNSVFNLITSVGGGKGANTDFQAGSNGGSGGGPWYSSTRGLGTTNQGFESGVYGGLNGWTGGGGGGAGSVGGDGDNGGLGGLGIESGITGANVTRAAGGRSNQYSGGNYSANGAANTGNGASGIGNGGSGVVILRYLPIFSLSNPSGGLTYTTTTVGSYKVTTFTAGTGTITFSL